jgi:hypothetical protein
MKKPELQMLGELVLVAAGVYLGIVASDWNDGRKEAARQRDFLRTLSQEIAANEQKLQSSLAYRKQVLLVARRLRATLRRDTLNAPFWSVGGFRLLNGWRGVAVPSLENSVYQSGLISNTLAGLDFPTINAIAQVYTLQEEYKVWTRALIIDKIVTVEGSVTTGQVLSKLEFWSDIINYEEELIKKHQAARRQLHGKLQ